MEQHRHAGWRAQPFTIRERQRLGRPHRSAIPLSIAAGTTRVASFQQQRPLCVPPPTTSPPLAPTVRSRLRRASIASTTTGTTNLFPTSSYNSAQLPGGCRVQQLERRRQPVTSRCERQWPLRHAERPLRDPGLGTACQRDTDPDGDTLTITGASGGVNGVANFNAQSNSVIFTPTTGYTGTASFDL